MLYKRGNLSEVRVTMGPMPKLKKSTPHSGAKRATQIHFLLTIPASIRIAPHLVHLVSLYASLQ